MGTKTNADDEAKFRRHYAEHIPKFRDHFRRLYHGGIPEPDDKSIDGLFSALNFWTSYPYHLASIGAFRDEAYGTKGFEYTRGMLELCHRKATELLCHRALDFGISSGPIATAAKLCVELFKTDPKRYYNPQPTNGEYWPNVLGTARWELTADQQRIITDGENAVNALRTWAEAYSNGSKPAGGDVFSVAPEGETSKDVVTREPPAPPFLNLIIDHDKRIVSRKGHDASIDLSRRPALWEMFIAMFDAGARGLTKPEMQNKISGEWSSSGVHKYALNGELKAIAVVIPNREWRLADDGE